MKLLKTVKESWSDIGLLKWRGMLFGMVVGGYVAEFVIKYVWLIPVTALALAVRPAFAYLAHDAY